MFYIHKKKDGSRYVYLDYSASDGRIRRSAGIALETGQTIEQLGKADKNKLLRISLIISQYEGDCNLAHKPTVTSEIIDLLHDEIKGKPQAPKEPLTVHSLLSRYIDKAKKKEVHNKQGKVHSTSTINAYEILLSKVFDDGKLAKTHIENLTDKDFASFRRRLTATYSRDNEEKKQLSHNTIVTYNNLLASVLGATYKLGWHKKKIDGLYQSGETIDYPIYYSITELQKLYSHEFNNIEHERLRDVFVFGCFTCLRHSDYYDTDYKQAVKGSEMTIKLKKKGNQVKVPLHPIALQILNKYDYKLPKIKNFLFNRHIKKITKLAGFTEKTLFTRTHGGELKREYKEKWELTTSHTMRRSFATNALKNGLEQWSVMAIGGWKSDASFKKYLRMSKEDVKEAAFNSSFYKVTM